MRATQAPLILRFFLSLSFGLLALTDVAFTQTRFTPSQYADWVRSHPFLSAALNVSRERNHHAPEVETGFPVLITDWTSYLTYSVVESSIELIAEGKIASPIIPPEGSDDLNRLSLFETFFASTLFLQQDQASTIYRQHEALIKISEDYLNRELRPAESTFVREMQAAYLAIRALGAIVPFDTTPFRVRRRARTLLFEKFGEDWDKKLESLGLFRNNQFVDELNHWEGFSDKTRDSALGLPNRSVVRTSGLGPSSLIQITEQALRLNEVGDNDLARNILARDFVLNAPQNPWHHSRGIFSYRNAEIDRRTELARSQLSPRQTHPIYWKSFRICQGVIWQLGVQSSSASPKSKFF